MRIHLLNSFVDVIERCSIAFARSLSISTYLLPLFASMTTATTHDYGYESKRVDELTVATLWYDAFLLLLLWAVPWGSLSGATGTQMSYFLDILYAFYLLRHLWILWEGVTWAARGWAIYLNGYTFGSVWDLKILTLTRSFDGMSKKQFFENFETLLLSRSITDEPTHDIVHDLHETRLLLFWEVFFFGKVAIQVCELLQNYHKRYLL